MVRAAARALLGPDRHPRRRVGDRRREPVRAEVPRLAGRPDDPASGRAIHSPRGCRGGAGRLPRGGGHSGGAGADRVPAAAPGRGVAQRRGGPQSAEELVGARADHSHRAGHRRARAAGARARRGAADGGAGPLRRRRRARLRQPAHRHSGLHQSAAARSEAGRPAARRTGGDPTIVGAGRRAHAADPRLRPAPRGGVGAGGRQPAHRQPGAPAPAADRRRSRARDGAGAFHRHGARGPRPPRAGDHEPGDQCARRDAARRPAHHRHRERARHRLRPAREPRAAARPVRPGHGSRHRHRDRPGRAAVHLRAVLHHQGAGARPRARARRRSTAS